MVNISSISDAATTLLVRTTQNKSLEIFLVRRPKNIKTFPGMYVFPGGIVEKRDTNAPKLLNAQKSGVEPQFFMAAQRETLEECGLAISLQSLVPISWWVTPKTEMTRFNTVFFLSEVKNEMPKFNPDEFIDALWLSPERALEKYRGGTLPVLPPTMAMLEWLAEHESLASLRSSITYPLKPVTPHPTFRDNRFVLLLPSDKEYPLEPHPLSFRRTRFVMGDHGFFS